MTQSAFKLSLFSLIVLHSFSPLAQTTKRALFLGNSYTFYNNLPQLTADVALSVGDTLIVDSNTPGGTTFSDHVGNATSLNLIAQGDWDYVVLQEQSQLPSFALDQVEMECFPYAAQLNDLIIASNPCTETMYYMTWGRENGDDQNCEFWPPVCTYEGMDDLLQERYMMMGEDNDAEVSPVGAVWRYIRENNPEVDLYFSDGSHPSEAGSYAAAVCFYTCIFRKSPENVTFNFTLDETVASVIRNAVQTIVFESIESWYIGSYEPQAALAITGLSELNYAFENTSEFGETFYLSIAEGAYVLMTDEVVNYEFPEVGVYNISIIAERCGTSDTMDYVLDLNPVGVIEQQADHLVVYPNPASEVIFPKFDVGVESMDIEIYNSSGMLCRKERCRHGSSVDISDLKPGIYMLREGHGWATSFIKE